ncbi:MAG TPA: ATP-binding protein [Patescibacteria group bacterium]|nr:ATP-binding protein [Patescibacteria group bacterium]
MRLNLRTAWLEIAAGFHLLFAAVAAYELRGGVSRVGGWNLPGGVCISMMILAAGAVFMLHPARTSRATRQGLFLFAGVLSAIGAAWFLSSGRFVIGALQVVYAAWLLGASFVPCLDECITEVGAERARGLGLAAGAALLAFGARFLAAGADVPWHARPAAACAIVFGAGLIAAELRFAPRFRLPASALAAAALLYYGIASVFGGDAGTAGALLSLFALLLLSTNGGVRMPEAADDLAGATPRQREIYVYERMGELTVWAIAAVSSLFVNFIGSYDARLYFSALLAIAFVTQYSYRLRPAVTISERRYLGTFLAVVCASIALISATGGVLGPFIYLAYLAVFAGTVIIRPVWSVIVAGIYAAYVALDLVAHVAASDHGDWAYDNHVPRFLFLATTLVFTGIYTAWTGKRRMRADEALLAANRRLAAALREAVRERERYERQALDLKGLNENLLEMRSALMNVLEDVEESKRQIEAERRREIASFNALAEGVIAADKNGRIFLCNPTAARVLGTAAELVVGQQLERVLRLFQEDDAVMRTRSFEEAYAGRTVALGDRLRLMRQDGSHVPVSGNVAPYLDEENRTTGIVVAFRDVTVEREIDRQKSDFISIASHQLRTPLSALRWFLDLLLAGDAGALKPTQREYLGDMSVSVTRMIKLVGDLLNISRIESGRTKPNPERVDTRAFVDSMAREIEPLARQKRLAFTHATAKEAVDFYADPNLARQALSNVLSNAVKYTPEGGSVALDVAVKGRETVFRVKDTGLGIPKSQRYRVFDKFFRGENVVAQETVGSGLGLYVVKTIMDMSGGRVRFDSVEGKGTTFELAFPNEALALPDAASGGTLSA